MNMYRRRNRRIVEGARRKPTAYARLARQLMLLVRSERNVVSQKKRKVCHLADLALSRGYLSPRKPGAASSDTGGISKR
jgi:hypothetical protein